jgi:hypothetical protein
VLDLSKGIGSESAEASYQEWLARNSTGLVLNLKRGRNKQFSLHRATCPAISYKVEEKGQSGRAGKVCFESESQLEQYCQSVLRVSRSELNRCSRC